MLITKEKKKFINNSNNNERRKNDSYNLTINKLDKKFLNAVLLKPTRKVREIKNKSCVDTGFS